MGNKLRRLRDVVSDVVGSSGNGAGTEGNYRQINAGSDTDPSSAGGGGPAAGEAPSNPPAEPPSTQGLQEQQQARPTQQPEQEHPEQEHKDDPTQKQQQSQQEPSGREVGSEWNAGDSHVKGWGVEGRGVWQRMELEAGWLRYRLKKKKKKTKKSK